MPGEIDLDKSSEKLIKCKYKVESRWSKSEDMEDLVKEKALIRDWNIGVDLGVITEHLKRRKELEFKRERGIFIGKRDIL